MTSETVWVVDDDPIFRMIFGMTLKKCYPKMKVVEYEDGQKACSAFSGCIESGKELPFSIFMDINMPLMDGWECMDEIQSLIESLDEYNPPIYIVSSSINPDDERRANAHPITSGYLVKPITIEVFKEIFD